MIVAPAGCYGNSILSLLDASEPAALNAWNGQRWYTMPQQIDSSGRSLAWMRARAACARRSEKMEVGAGDGLGTEKIRVLIAKPGLDGHDRGAKVVARALRDAGFEVIYTGIRQTPQMIAEAALQEDVDVVGLSILSGAHMTLCPRVVELLRGQGQEHVIVLVGGIVPDEDISRLQEAGIRGVFGPGASTETIAGFIRQAVAEAATA